MLRFGIITQSRQRSWWWWWRFILLRWLNETRYDCFPSASSSINNTIHLSHWNNSFSHWYSHVIYFCSRAWITGSEHNFHLFWFCSEKNKCVNKRTDQEPLRLFWFSSIDPVAISDAISNIVEHWKWTFSPLQWIFCTILCFIKSFGLYLDRTVHLHEIHRSMSLYPFPDQVRHCIAHLYRHCLDGCR